MNLFLSSGSTPLYWGFPAITEGGQGGRGWGMCLVIVTQALINMNESSVVPQALNPGYQVTI